MVICTFPLSQLMLSQLKLEAEETVCRHGVVMKCLCLMALPSSRCKALQLFEDTHGVTSSLDNIGP